MNERPRVLVIDDESAIRESLAFALDRDRFDVVEAGDLRTAREHWSGADLLILDLMLPDGSGTEFLTWLRKRSSVPVLILTSRDEEVDRIVGLELGADDYVVKPFSPREVVARVRAVLRRTSAPLRTEPPVDDALVGAGGLRLEPSQRRAWVGGAEVQLSRLQFDLLATFMQSPGRVFERDTLLDRVWGDCCVVGDRTVDVHVKELRRKLVEAGGTADLIETVRGVGYRLRDEEP